MGAGRGAGVAVARRCPRTSEMKALLLFMAAERRDETRRDAIVACGGCANVVRFHTM